MTTGKNKVTATSLNSENNPKQTVIRIPGVVVPGHGVASGQSKTSPYKGGSLRMQIPYFEQLGIPLDRYFLGTINLDISPRRLKLTGWDYEARQVAWTNLIPPEDFLFSHCGITFQDKSLNAMVYYPTPETKVENFHHPHLVEILAPYQQGLNYGAEVGLDLNSHHCSLT